MDLASHIRIVHDFPQPGINFYDIVPVLAHPEGLKTLVESISKLIRANGDTLHFIAGIEARGFPIAAAIAIELGLGLLLIRKPGKLPGDILRQDYTLEYGTDAVELSQNVVGAGQNVAIVDDVLATGGTVSAASKLLKKSGAHVACAAFFIELEGLNGAQAIEAPCSSLLKLPA